MASDYTAIRADNERRYGTDIGRIGPMLLADRYDDRTHFIFELLQNAEDALARRAQRGASRAVTFTLSGRRLRVSHFGIAFSEADVRGICGIAEGTKDFGSIGRFGIGFKSVYAYTDRPEIHSGDEHFAIDSFVLPDSIDSVATQPGETIFDLPFRQNDISASEEITAALQGLGPRTLLFLKEIHEISWAVEGGTSGRYKRKKSKLIGPNVRRVVVIGEEAGSQEVTRETWLLFSREVQTTKGEFAGQVEVGFLYQKVNGRKQRSVQPIDDSSLVVFFPTVVATNLGFLVQGPYRTTPSRDNILRTDPWNQRLIRETAALLVEVLLGLRGMGLLNVDALHSLPLDRVMHEDGTLFNPLFETVRTALASKALLPRFGGGHVAGRTARLSRTQELRELLSASQLTTLLQSEERLQWLSEEITQDRTPVLRQYLLRELNVTEVTPETILPRLSGSFLVAQTDRWIMRLYEFLHSQPALRRSRQFDEIPLIRLEDGRHVTPKKDGQLQAFLPTRLTTDFPTVRRAVCGTEAARQFLTVLGLTEPDPVDDVIKNMLPKYAGQEVDVSDEDYKTDVQRILLAFGTDSKIQREKLLDTLRNSSFVIAVDAGDGSKWVSKPGGVYLATQRLKELFEGVGGVLLVNDGYSCLRGEDVRELLEACGATRYLQPVPMQPRFSSQERREMRRQGGCEDCSREEPIEDYDLRGLEKLLEILSTLDAASAVKRASLLWDALSDVQDRRGTTAFFGEYRWYYVNPRSCAFPAAFVRKLNDTAWVPDSTGELQRPEFIVFDNLGWKPNPFLLSRIRFKPPAIEALAREAGIEPGVLDLLKKLGVTSEAELRKQLGMKEETQQFDSKPDLGAVDDAVKNLVGGTSEPTPPVPDPTGPEPRASAGSGGGGPGPGGNSDSRSRGGTDESATGGNRTRERPRTGAAGAGKRTADSVGGRPFISYVGAHPDEEVPDPDGLDQQRRMALEEKAIALILAGEPQLRRTPTNNPGYDLYEAGDDGQPLRWIEVKAMAGSLHDRPVGLSRTQFECAQQHTGAYWLYIVEHAGNDGADIVRIQDPAGKAQTFTFDRGWLGVADAVAEREDRGD